MKILFLTTILLSKKRNGSEVATQCFIDAFRANGHQVSVVGYLRKGDSIEHTDPDIVVVSERYTETKTAKFYTLYWILWSFFKQLPYSSVKYYSNNYIRTVKKLLLSQNYDVAVIDHPQLFWLKNLIESIDKKITISHNLEHELYQETARKTNSFLLKSIYRREALLIKSQEDRLVTRVNQVWTVTENDAKYFSSLAGAARAIAFTLPPASEKLLDKPLSKNFDIGLLGSWTWRANEEALQWFLESIYPKIPNSLSIHIAGKGADWLTGKYQNVHYRGIVPDAQEFMAQAKVVAIPTLSGGGIQIKTLDAIASGSLIVATPVAVRGIFDPPQTVQVAEQPEDFAKLLVSAIASPDVPQAFKEARNWYNARRDKFISDVACAINEL